MNGKDYGACFVGEYHIVLGGCIVKELEAFFHVSLLGLLVRRQER